MNNLLETINTINAFYVQSLGLASKCLRCNVPIDRGDSSLCFDCRIADIPSRHMPQILRDCVRDAYGSSAVPLLQNKTIRKELITMLSAEILDEYAYWKEDGPRT